MENKSLYSSKFVHEHPTGNLIQPSNTEIKFPIQLELLQAYKSDEIIEHQIAVFVNSRDFLPMPICFSPVLLYIMKLPWTFKYTDSISTINIMKTIIDCYSVKSIWWYQNNSVKIDEAKRNYNSEILKLENECYKQWNDLLTRYKNKQQNEKETIHEFLQFMEKTTLKRIWLMEKCILEMFNYNNLINVLITPNFTPDATKLKEDDQKLISVSLCKFFLQKQGIRNERLKKQTNTHTKDIQYFNIDDMQTRLQKLSKDQIYKNYMDRLTAMEYLNFLDVDEILK